MKKIISLTVIIVLAFSVMIPVCAEDKPMLSSFSDAEIVEFLESEGIEIPALYSADMSWMTFIRFVIETVEVNPAAEFTFGYVVAEEFAYAIKAAANTYYGITGKTRNTYVSTENILEDNTVHGNWSDAYEDYNCLGYAVNYYDDVAPGQIEWIINGNPKDHYIYNWHANVEQVCDWVRDDLESKDCTIVSVSKSIPTAVITDHSHLICVRIDTDGEFVYGFRDFHLMKLAANGYWYHKPGKTNPLRYKHTPSSGNDWILESYDGEEYKRSEEVTYDSDIWFIKYTSPHKYEYEYCGSNKHILTCTICGGTSGSASSCIYINNTCKFCGNYNGHTQIKPNKRPGTAVAVTE